jgi:hypothetical protein
MWFNWLCRQVLRNRGMIALRQHTVDVVCRTKDGREFSPFSIEWRGSTLILCENEEAS